MRRAFCIFALTVAALDLAARDAHAQDTPVFGDCKVGNIRTEGRVPEKIPGRPDANRMTLTGSASNPVVITCDDTILYADKVVYEDDTRDLIATGNVLFQQNDVRLFADHAT